MPIWGGKPQDSVAGAPCALNPTEPAVTYQIPYSLRFRLSAKCRLRRSVSVVGNKRKWTWASWVKRGAINNIHQMLFGTQTVDGEHYGYLRINDANQFEVFDFNGTRGSFAWRVTAAPLLRDPSAWYHLVVQLDLDQPTPANQVRLYINGVLAPLTNAGYPPAGWGTTFNWPVEHTIGWYIGEDTNYFDGYLADYYFIDGQALDANSFGAFDATTGVWMPKAYAGAYGTNGFKLAFDDAANLGKDSSGNNNHWTANNFSVSNAAAPFSDQMVDSPTNYGTDTGLGGEVRGNYCTMNPLDSGATAPSNGNVDVFHLQNDTGCFSTFAMTQGRYWAEIAIQGTYLGCGVAKAQVALSGADAYNGSYNYQSNTGRKAVLGVNTGNAATYTTGDVIGIDLDITGGNVTFYKQTGGAGAFVLQWTSPLAANSSGYKYFSFNSASNQGNHRLTWNFGQRPFNNTAVPSGSKALCSTNLPKAQLLPKNHFDIVLDAGATIKATADAKNMPGLMWIKDRQNANNHQLIDVLRGANALHSNDALAESAYVPPTGNSVAWMWRGGSQSANSLVCQGAGFSVIRYTGGSAQSVNHLLGVTPAMIITKRVDGSQDWYVWHQALAATENLVLNGIAAKASGGIFTGAPTSSAFNVSATPAGTQIAMCFAEVASFSKMGTFTGNNLADGSFVYCGFKPAYLLIRATAGSGWFIWDYKRDTYNPAVAELFANTTALEAGVADLDILSNGFKMRSTTANNGEMIYAAFAEHPFQYARAR